MGEGGLRTPCFLFLPMIADSGDLCPERRSKGKGRFP
jgi:hypothetical protein